MDMQGSWAGNLVSKVLPSCVYDHNPHKTRVGFRDTVVSREPFSFSNRGPFSYSNNTNLKIVIQHSFNFNVTN